MLSKVSLFTVGIISVVQTNGEHLRTSTGSKYHPHHPRCACPGTCDKTKEPPFTPGKTNCFMKVGPHGGKYCDTKWTTGYCCVKGPAPMGCPGYVAHSTTGYPTPPVDCGNSGAPGTYTCGPSCSDKCEEEYHPITDPMPTTETPHQQNCGQYGLPHTYTCGPSCMEPCQVMYQATTGYPTTEVPVTEDPTMPPMPPTAPTDHYYFHRGFGQGLPAMAVNINKKAGCRCANMMATPFPKVASVCHNGCGIHDDTQLCADAAKDPAFGPGKNGMARPHCSGACKPDTSKMTQPGNQQDGPTKLTFEDCSNQCAEMGPAWSMIDSGSRKLAEGSGCGFDFEEVWSKHM